MTEFDTNKRSLDANWLLAQIDILILSAKKFSNSSFVIYAALETRNLFERIEFDLLAIAAKGTDTEIFLRGIRGKTGIKKTNDEYKVLKFRYQSFSSAVTKAIFEGGSLNKFDYKKSEEFCSKLSQYIHTYSRLPEDIIFESEFISSGISLIEECINYLMEEFFEIINGYITYGVFDFKTLTPSVKMEFDKWLIGVDENEEDLIKRLIEINNRENGGKKTCISPSK
ncbi:hypothetical protein [Cognataquiflexum rubidum]|uniref:hypothetical protein n=1 Tax=Cognataquiflexum rubidum TaxID=2922273 RepID=UPI001F1480B3|nr:hypothetical protein [Cognataquiflexum rubidum]MCH6235032.1 hypothetical protein [Cognataquiflexum rubidum]